MTTDIIMFALLFLTVVGLFSVVAVVISEPFWDHEETYKDLTREDL